MTWWESLLLANFRKAEYLQCHILASEDFLWLFDLNQLMYQRFWKAKDNIYHTWLILFKCWIDKNVQRFIEYFQYKFQDVQWKWMLHVLKRKNLLFQLQNEYNYIYLSNPFVTKLSFFQFWWICLVLVLQ